MARSNGPGPRGGPHPSLPAGNNGHEQPHDPRYAQQQQPVQQPAGNWQQQAQQAQHAPVSDGTYPSQDPHAQQQQPGYHYPQSQESQLTNQHDPRFANPGDPVAHGGQPAQGDPNQYAPQFTPYAPQTADPYQAPAQQGPAGAPHYDDTPVTGAHHQVQQGYPAQAAQAPQTMENPAYPQAQQGQFNQRQEEWQQTGQPAGPAPDAHGYDAGGYAGAGQPIQGAPDYLTHPEYAAQADPYAAQQDMRYADDPSLQAGHGEFDQGFEEDSYTDEFETASGGGKSRMLLIAGALVGAIVVGGGLAYGWKMISGPAGGKNTETPVVRSGTSPSKTRPVNPGGRQFDHTDSKILGRLGGTGAGTSRSDSNGTKKVPTLSVSRNGQIAGPTATASPDSKSEISVPGLTVVDAFGAASRHLSPTARSVTVRQPIVVKPPDTTAPTRTKPRVQVRSAPKKPIVITKRTTPTTTPAAPKTRAPVKPKPQATRKKPAAPASTASVRKKLKAPTQATSKPVTSGSKGFVAVLASVPLSSSSRMNALMKYADLQQKYSTLLANKTPDVREANLGSRGKYHRLLVGPPGSHSQASSLCSKLKSAGYSGCWVTSY